MSDEGEFLKELEKLSAASTSSAKVDSTVDNKISSEGRKRMLTGLSLINDKLSRDLALKTQSSIEKPLVRSHPSIYSPYKLTQEIESMSARLTSLLVIEGTKGLGVVDNKSDRTLIFDEFANRFVILVNEVINGRLDDLLGLPPELVVHGIMGLSGEFLNRLNIDPKKGETYALIEGQLKNSITNTKNKPDYSSQIKRMEDTFKELAKRVTEPSTSDVPATKPVYEARAGDSDIPTTIPTFNTQEGVLELPRDITVGSVIGLVIFTLTNEIKSYMGLEKETKGVLVIGILKNSIAEKAGVREGTTPAVFDGTKGMLGGDIILGIEDKTINNKEELTDYMSHYHKPETQIKFKVLRNKKPIEITLVY